MELKKKFVLIIIAVLLISSGCRTTADAPSYTAPPTAPTYTSVADEINATYLEFCSFFDKNKLSLQQISQDMMEMVVGSTGLEYYKGSYTRHNVVKGQAPTYSEALDLREYFEQNPELWSVFSNSPFSGVIAYSGEGHILASTACYFFCYIKANDQVCCRITLLYYPQESCPEVTSYFPVEELAPHWGLCIEEWE